MRRFLRLLLCLALALTASSSWAATDLTAAMPHVQGSRKIVLEALDKLLAGAPDTQLLGQGSWLRPPKPAQGGGLSRNYADPLLGGTSDHDLRLVFNGNDREAAQQWVKSQNTLRESIRGLFRGKSAAEIEETLLRYGFNRAEAASLARQGGQRISETILKSVNLYPPNQLMRFVVDQRGAEAAFRQLKSVPNLGGTMVEGVWGTGQAARVQQLEASGRLFYRASSGRAMAGFTDLVHMAEGYGRYSLGGSANMASQWADKALEALHERDPELLGKYLRRLKAELKLARSQGKLTGPAMSDTFRALDDVIAKAGQGAAVFDDAALRGVIRNAQSDARLLGELARNPGAADRQIINAILGNAPGRWEKLSNQLRRIKEGVAEAVTFERVLNGVLLYMGTLQVSEKAGSEGLEAALRSAGAETAMLVSIGPGIMLALTNAILDSAKDAGYTLAVSAQDWDDFLAGISGVKGYQGETALNRNIEQLAVGLSREDEVRRFVALQARNVAQLKETGAASEAAATARSRTAIEETLVRRMTPLVLQQWYQARKRRMVAYLDLAQELDQRMNDLILRGEVNPEPAYLENGAGAVTFALRPEQDLRPIKELLARMESTIEPLGGTQRDVFFFDKTEITWEAGGDKRQAGSGSGLAPGDTQVYRFTAPGVHEVVATVKYTLNIQTAGGLEGAPDVFRAQPLLRREYSWQVPMSVHVAEVLTVKAEPVKPSTLEAPAEITASELFRLRLDLRQDGGKKPGKYKVMLMQPGRKLTQEDLMLLSYNVGAPDRTLVSHPVEILSSRFDNGFLEIEGQVSDLYESDLADSKRLELAFVFLDRAGSLEYEMNQAMADLEKAQEEMDRKMAAMTPEQVEKVMEEMDKAIAEAERNPPPPPPDPGKEPLREGVVISRPILLRPVELKLPPPAGWRAGKDERRWSRVIERVVDQPRSGARINAQGRIEYQLASGGLAGWEYDAMKGKGQPYRLDDWSGWRQDAPAVVSTHAAGHQSAEAQRISRQHGSLALRRGAVFLTIRYHLEASGFQRFDEKKELLYDTFEQADAEFERLRGDLAEVVGQVKTVASGTATPAAVVPPEAQPGYARGVRLVAAKTRLAPGEIVEIRAVVDGLGADERIVRYDWSGNHEGKDAAVRFIASEPGSYSLGVTITGNKGVLGSGWINLEVR